jgi:nucleoside triphosphate pyrophosphatase
MRSVVGSGQKVWAGKDPLVLASKSSSRYALLAAAGLEVEVFSPEIDERAVEERYFAEGGSIDGLALRLAQAKAVTASSLRMGAYCLGADQTLTVGGRLLHKPHDRVQAASSLAMLAGCTHRLTSAFCVARNGKPLFLENDTADLQMRPLDACEIARYLDLAGPPVLSSVGAYQVEGLGLHLFDRIDGDHSTILGLPMLKLLGWLRRRGLIVI